MDASQEKLASARTTEPFFTRSRSFYKSLFSILLLISLQNIVAYSVNMIDNIMMGAYSQASLSGAATVNQVFFLIQQVTLTIGNALVILCAQYWGERKLSPIRTLAGVALKLGFSFGVLSILLCAFFPGALLSFFTRDAEIIREGRAYLSIIQYTFLFFILSSILMALLRSVETVRISFYVSIVSLLLNSLINYTLIFGHFGFPEMGIRGAAIGTLVSRAVEFLLVFFYVLKIDRKIRLFSENFLRPDPALRRDYLRVAAPVILTGAIWAISVPLQTAILGHLPGEDAADAIAANSVATTFYQYLKVVVSAMASASTVMIGKAIGRGDLSRVKAEARTMSVLDVAVGIVLALLLYLLRLPLLSMYSLNDNTYRLANELILVMCIVMVGMSYQMPVSMGILQGGGDTRFALIMNTISTWAIVMPLSLLAAFVWRLPVPLIVLCIQSDQIFKGIPTFLRMRSYRWMKKLTKN